MSILRPPLQRRYALAVILDLGDQSLVDAVARPHQAWPRCGPAAIPCAGRARAKVRSSRGPPPTPKKARFRPTKNIHAYPRTKTAPVSDFRRKYSTGFRGPARFARNPGRFSRKGGLTAFAAAQGSAAVDSHHDKRGGILSSRAALPLFQKGRGPRGNDGWNKGR